MNETGSTFLNKQDEEDSQALNRAAMSSRRLRKTTLPNTVEKLQEELRNVLIDLEEKQRDATLAAQYGSTLIQSNDKLRSEIEEMNTKLEAAYENMTELHQSYAEQSTQNTQLRTNNNVLSNQVRDAQKENQILMQEFQQVSEILEKEKKKNKQIHLLTERKKELEQEIEKYFNITEKYEELLKRESSLSNKHKKLQQEYQKQLFELTDYRSKVNELSESLQNQNANHLKIQSLSHQLEQTQRNVKELKEEKKILEEMPLLSQFSEISTLRSLLLQNRQLLENLDFADLQNESKNIVNSLLSDIPNDDNDNNPKTSDNDGKPTNAFYLLTSVLTHRKYEELHKKLKIDSITIQQITDELNELQTAKNSFSQTLERAEKQKDKLKEKLNEKQREFNEYKITQEELITIKDNNINNLKEQLQLQSHKISSSQANNEERLKRRIEELASLEVDYNNLKNNINQINDENKQTKTKLIEAENKNNEFQDIILKLNVEKGDLLQQISNAKREIMALQKTKESQQEMLDNIRKQYQDKIIEVNNLQGDLVNLQEVCEVTEEQIEVGKEEIDILQKHNDLLNSQIIREREKHSKQSETYLHEIKELNELIQMMQTLEEEQLELDTETTNFEEGDEQIHVSLRKENMELKKKLHDSLMEVSLLIAEKQVTSDQLALLEDDINFKKNQIEKDHTAELQYREVLNDQILQLQERLASAEELRINEINNLEILKQRTFRDLQLQLAKEQSINQSNITRISKLMEQNKDLELTNNDLIASMSMMIKDSGEECKRIDELEELLRKSNIQHNNDKKTIKELTKKIQILQNRMKHKRPYFNTLAPPTPLVISSFPLLQEELENQLTEEIIITNNNNLTSNNDLNTNKELIDNNNLKLEETENQTESKLIKDVFLHINDNLHSSDSNDNLVTLKQENRSLLLCNLINNVIPDTIDTRAINPHPKSKDEEIENLTLCLNSAKAIGCDIPSSMEVNDLINDNFKIEQLTWEIVRTQLLQNVSLKKHPELHQLQQDMELQAQIIDIQSLTSEDILLHWTNHHLSKEENLIQSKITNFDKDLQSLEIHYGLLHQLCYQKGIELSHIKWNNEDTFDNKIEIINNLAEKLDCKRFLYPVEIQNCNKQLNIAFLANLLHHHSGLQLLYPTINNNNDINQNIEEDHGTREERAFRLWINSLGIGRYVYNLQTDVRDGLILLKVFDKISPGIVQWNRVNQNPNRLGMYRKVENCTLCIKYGRDLGFSLVGIGGKDIFDGNRKFILALVWQMMQSHILSILRSVSKDKNSKITESDIVIWANSKVSKVYGNEYTIENLKSHKLPSSKYIAQLINSVVPEAVNFDFIKENENEYENNAKYVISIARKIGCCIFLVWEDLVELNHKMIFTLVATLMLLDNK